MIDDKEWDRAVEALTGAREVAVACHIFPDGDALGSMLGIGLHLRRLGKRVWMGWGSPQLRVPPQYAFLPGLDLVGGEPPAAPEVFLAVDCAQDTRLDLLLPVFKALCGSLIGRLFTIFSCFTSTMSTLSLSRMGTATYFPSGVAAHWLGRPETFTVAMVCWVAVSMILRL